MKLFVKNWLVYIFERQQANVEGERMQPVISRWMGVISEWVGIKPRSAAVRSIRPYISANQMAHLCSSLDHLFIACQFVILYYIS